MSYQINNSDYNEYGSSCDEYTNTLIKENQQLNILNNKLHKRCLNQKRKILRLKKIIEQSKDIAVNLESNIEDTRTSIYLNLMESSVLSWWPPITLRSSQDPPKIPQNTRK